MRRVVLMAVFSLLVFVNTLLLRSLFGWPGIVGWAAFVFATLADALTPLGLLNFCVLQWFGVRLARKVERRAVWRRAMKAGEMVRAGDIETRLVTVGYTTLRWICPLTGWWTDFRYIARRS